MKAAARPRRLTKPWRCELPLVEDPHSVPVRRCSVQSEDSSEDEVPRTKYSGMQRSTLTTTCRDAERRVAILIDETNRIHVESPVTPWGYELTVQIHNIGIVATETSKTLLVNPSWLRFVIEVDDFEACVADEIVAWYLIQDLTCTHTAPSHRKCGGFN